MDSEPRFVGVVGILFADASPASVQIRRIQGRVVDEQGQLVQDATRSYERAADLYPGAQSALRSLAGESGAERVEPRWDFYEHHTDDADALLKRMWAIPDTTR